MNSKKYIKIKRRKNEKKTAEHMYLSFARAIFGIMMIHILILP